MCVYTHTIFLRTVFRREVIVTHAHTHTHTHTYVCGGLKAEAHICHVQNGAQENKNKIIYIYIYV